MGNSARRKVAEEDRVLSVPGHTEVWLDKDSDRHGCLGVAECLHGDKSREGGACLKSKNQ